MTKSAASLERLQAGSTSVGAEEQAIVVVCAGQYGGRECDGDGDGGVLVVRGSPAVPPPQIEVQHGQKRQHIGEQPGHGNKYSLLKSQKREPSVDPAALIVVARRDLANDVEVARP